MANTLLLKWLKLSSKKAMKTVFINPVRFIAHKTVSRCTLWKGQHPWLQGGWRFSSVTTPFRVLYFLRAERVLRLVSTLYRTLKSWFCPLQSEEGKNFLSIVVEMIAHQRYLCSDSWNLFICWVIWWRRVTILDVIKVANQLTCRWRNYPGLSRWARCNHNDRH